MDLVAAHLHHPGLERADPIGEERDELAVARNRRVELGAFPVRQPRESGAGERVLPEVVALAKAPSHDSESQQNRRGDRRGNPASDASAPAPSAASPPVPLETSERLSRIVASSRARSSVEA